MTFYFIFLFEIFRYLTWYKLIEVGNNCWYIRRICCGFSFAQFKFANVYGWFLWRRSSCTQSVQVSWYKLIEVDSNNCWYISDKFVVDFLLYIWSSCGAGRVARKTCVQRNLSKCDLNIFIAQTQCRQARSAPGTLQIVEKADAICPTCPTRNGWSIHAMLCSIKLTFIWHWNK